MYFFKENPDCSSKNPEISDDLKNSETSENLHATILTFWTTRKIWKVLEENGRSMPKDKLKDES